MKYAMLFFMLGVIGLRAQPGFVSGKDVFGTRVFIENNGQFKVPGTDAPVKYAYENGNENVYFTNKGVVYKQLKRAVISEKDRERWERGKKVRSKADEIHYVYMNWKNANADIKIIEEDKKSHYMSYGDKELVSSCFKKITYKNVYDHIDIEYSIPEDKDHGIKYNVILHPGANPADIQMVYRGDIKKIKLKGNEIVVRTHLDDIVEHVPVSFYSGTKAELDIAYTLSGNTVGFNFPANFVVQQELVIDPWVTAITTLTNNNLSNNMAYDVDFDNSGNLFVFGGVPSKVAKYSAGGTLLWTFNGIVPSINWQTNFVTGNFAVSRQDGKCYVAQGDGSNWVYGFRLVRIDAAGVYDNFVTVINLNLHECWELCHTGCGNNSQLFAYGGGIFSNASAATVNLSSGVITPVNFTGFPGYAQDICCHAIDNQGNQFTAFAAMNLTVNNRLMRINQSYNGNMWLQPSQYYSMVELNNKQFYPFGPTLTSGYNCLAVNDNYVYYYNGISLAAYNKSTGAQLATITSPGFFIRQQGGIAADNCGNVYVGAEDTIQCFNFNGTSFSTLPDIALNSPSTYKKVFDLRLNQNNGKLYVCGSGFCGIVDAIYSNNCTAISSSINVSCTGNGSGNAVVTISTSIPSPTVDYIWTQGNNTVSTTYGSTSMTNSVNLTNGTYTLSAQINAPCGPLMTTTVNICCLGAVSASVSQLSCSNPVNSASVSVSGSSIVPVVTWIPAPGNIGSPPLTATNLPVGISTVQLDFGASCIQVYTFNVLPPPPAVNFTINNLSSSYSITCTNTVVLLQTVSNYTAGSLSYYWNSAVFTASTTSAAIYQPTTFTLTVYDAATGCDSAAIVSIGINTTSPLTSVSPPSQVINCTSSVSITFSGTVSSPIINLQNEWFSPLSPPPAGPPIASSNQTISLLSGSLSPGVYTLVTTDLVNGCQALKTVTVTSMDAWPTFSMNSPTNFSLGCSPLNQTTLSIVNPVSTQTPPATCSYTFLPPGFSGPIPPGPYPSGNTSTTTAFPGTWTVIVMDNSNNCKSILSVPVVQNTVSPQVAASLLQHTLTCYHPTLLATGSSSTQNTIITWNQPQTPPQVSTNTISIGPGSGPNTSSTSLTYANYSVIATNTLNACQTTSVITISQNFKPPVSSPIISVGTPSAIYCTAASNPVVLSAGNSTTTSGGGPLAFAVPVLWEGPVPQQTVSGASSYSCYVPGVYSLTIMDNYNGCKHTATLSVLDRTQPPVITQPESIALLDCGESAAVLLASITGPSTGLMYWYVSYPPGAAFSPTDAIEPNVNSLLSGTSSSSVSVSLTGIYQYLVTNTLTGCIAPGIFQVENGELNAEFIPDLVSGYAPLLVTFTNNSSSSLGSSDITSVWSFGNGVAQTTTSNISTSAYYDAPGTYTVLLTSSKGKCLDTSIRIIRLEIPSKLDVPNIFSPNGDGTNDVFFLKASNLKEISAVIFDRWGNKVYETGSSTGNIAWDGRNLRGKECAPGVYLYVIRAKGADGAGYSSKGNITLVR